MIEMTSIAIPINHFSIQNWSEVDKWTSIVSLLHYPNIPKNWRIMKIRSLVSQLTEKHLIEANRNYKLAGIRWYGEGVFHRETVKGKDLSSKYLFPLIPNSFIYNLNFLAWGIASIQA